MATFTGIQLMPVTNDSSKVLCDNLSSDVVALPKGTLDFFRSESDGRRRAKTLMKNLEEMFGVRGKNSCTFWNKCKNIRNGLDSWPRVLYVTLEGEPKEPSVVLLRSFFKIFNVEELPVINRPGKREYGICFDCKDETKVFEYENVQFVFFEKKKKVRWKEADYFDLKVYRGDLEGIDGVFSEIVDILNDPAELFCYFLFD